MKGCICLWVRVQPLLERGAVFGPWRTAVGPLAGIMQKPASQCDGCERSSGTMSLCSLGKGACLLRETALLLAEVVGIHPAWHQLKPPRLCADRTLLPLDLSLPLLPPVPRSCSRNTVPGATASGNQNAESLAGLRQLQAVET